MAVVAAAGGTRTLRRGAVFLLGRFGWHPIIGAVATFFAFGLTLLLAFLAAERNPPTVGSLVLLAFISGMLQLFGAWMFAGQGKADPSLAQSSTRGLLRLAARAGLLRGAVEHMYEGRFAADRLQGVLGEVSVQASFIEEGIVEAIEDWRLFHPGAVAKAEEAMRGDDR